jgi:hypothetical protein
MADMVEQHAKQRRGCFFYGCVTSTILLLVALAGALAGYHYFRKMFNDFTSSQPLTMPPVRLTQPEIEKLQQRIDRFRDSVRQGEPAGPLALNADQINALIATDPDLKALKGKLYVTIEGGQLKGQISVPMEEAGLPIFRGRYLSGIGTFNILLRNGMLHITATAIQSTKGKPVPEVYMEKVRRQNLARDINSDTRAQAALDRIADIQIKETNLIIVPKKSE